MLATFPWGGVTFASYAPPWLITSKVITFEADSDQLARVTRTNAGKRVALVLSWVKSPNAALGAGRSGAVGDGWQGTRVLFVGEVGGCWTRRWLPLCGSQREGTYQLSW